MTARDPRLLLLLGCKMVMAWAGEEGRAQHANANWLALRRLLGRSGIAAAAASQKRLRLRPQGRRQATALVAAKLSSRWKAPG